jgi:glycosyltransferase involved in cell wall biosynthesis
MTIDACIITKDSAEYISKMLESIKPHVENIYVLDTGSTDNTLEVLKEHNCVIDTINPEDNPEYYVGLEGAPQIRFAKARNRSFKPATSEWILWIDSDDEFITRGDLAPLLEKAQEEGVTGIGCTYNYKLDGDKVISSHTKQRILKRDAYKWENDEDKWIVHENIYPVGEMLEMFTDYFQVNHYNPDFKKSALRNVRALKWMSQQMPEDPRVWYLLGRDAGGAKMPDLMEMALSKAVGMELSDKDYKSACIMLAELYESSGSYKIALDYAAMAHARQPLSPEPNIFMAKYYLLLGDNVEAIAFAKRATMFQYDAMSGAEIMPYEMTKMNTYILAEAYERLKMYSQSLDVLEQFSKLVKGKGDTKVLKQSIKETVEQARMHDVRQTFAKSAQQYSNMGEDPYKAEELLPKLDFPIPEQIQVRRALGDYKVHKDAVDFYCLNNFEKWDPGTILAKGGGGSETAVVELATRFQKAGYTVTVWGNPVEDGSVFDGVTWRDVYSFPYEDEFDILVSWRNVDLFKNYDIKADKKYLWLQDIMQPFDYTKDVIDQLDKVIVLSDYHRMTAPAVPSSKFYYTTNGINIDLIKEVEKEVGGIERVKGYCVNASSADRGLEHLVNFWERVTKDAPHATLSWYYGWHSWNVFAKFDWATELKEKIIKKMKEFGINEGGRIGKKELYKEYLKAEYWVYPLIGPAETSCITAMEAQALGAIPITTGITALEETQQYGIKVPLSKFEGTLITLLNKEEIGGEEEYREDMKKWAREHFSWDRVADRWIEDLFRGKLN